MLLTSFSPLSVLLETALSAPTMLLTATRSCNALPLVQVCKLLLSHLTPSAHLQNATSTKPTVHNTKQAF